MSNLKKLILVGLVFLITSCSLNNNQKYFEKNNFSIEIESPEDKHNVFFKENLKRLFYKYNSKVDKKYLLITDISFQSSETLSVSGLNVLKSTKANINYQLKNKNTNIILKSGSIDTFPALSSSSSSLFTQEKSIEHIKERLTRSSAKSLFMYINILIRRLS